jgi:hypothetical protein
MPGEKRRKTLTSRRLFSGGLRAAIDAARKTASGISSAAAVGSPTLGVCDKTTYFIVFLASFRQSEFCQNSICQKAVKNRSAKRSAVCGTFVKEAPSAPRTSASWRSQASIGSERAADFATARQKSGAQMSDLQSHRFDTADHEADADRRWNNERRIIETVDLCLVRSAFTGARSLTCRHH